MIYPSPWIKLILLMAIKMVLCGAVADAGDVIGNVSRVRRAPQPHYRVLTDEELDMTTWKRSHWREMQSILRREGNQREGVQCCPSVLEMVAKKGGRTPTGMYVELYEDGENKQRLYEVSCAKGVVDKPCRFVDARLFNDSRCIQKYSYSYALVRHINTATDAPQHREGYFSVPGSGGWSMDYVIVRSGCECQIKPSNKGRRRHKQRKRNRRIAEDDET